MADAIVQTIKIEVDGADEAAAEIKKLGEATEEVQAGAATAAGGTKELGGGLDEVSQKSGISSREMRGLGKIMKEMGAGDAAMLAVSFGKIGASLGTLGVAALAAAMAVGGITKFAKAAEENTKALEGLSEASGTSVESLRVLERQFESAGLSSKKFVQSMTEVITKVVSEAPKISDEIASSANRAIEAQNAVAKAGAESLDAQKQSAGFAVQDAAASLRSLELKRALLNNSISKAQYDRQAHIEESKALDVSIQKAQLAIETAEREKAAKDLLQQADPRGDAQRKANEALANSVGPVLEKYQQLSKGIKETIDPLTSQETRIKALILLMDQLGENDALAAFAKTFDTMSGPDKLKFAGDLKKLGFEPEQIALLEKGSVEFEKSREAAIKYEKAVGELKAALDKLNKGFQATTVAPKPVASGGEGLANFVKDLQRLGALEHAIIDPLITPVGGAWQWIVETARSVWEQVKPLAQQAWDAVVSFVTTAPGAAWQWIKDTAVSVWEQVKALAQQAYQSVVQFVTTAPGNAWQWLKDKFQEALDWIIAKWNATVPKFMQIGGGGGGGSSEPATQGMAGGGLLGGRGSGTSDSNLAWVSRGEHIMPARAVSQPGVLAFLEALRRSGGNLRGVLDNMGRFALGGLVMPTLSIPAFAGGGMSNVTIAFPGLPEITGLRASSAVVDELRQAAALAQVRSGGRKPSRYS